MLRKKARQPQSVFNTIMRPLRMLLIVWVTLIVLHAIVQSMIRRHLTEGEDA